MKKIFYKSFLLLFVSFCIANSTLVAQIQNTAEAINKAGKQRMLSQRIAKDYLLFGICTKTETLESAKTELSASVMLFEKHHNELLSYSSNISAELKPQLEKVHQIWLKYKEIIELPTNMTSAPLILNLSKELLASCEITVKIIEATVKTKKKANVISISGRQRMLSQRIALYYIGDVWQLDNASDIKDEYNKSISEFWKALKTLSSYKKNTKIIDNKLKVVKVLFKYESKGLKLNKVYTTEIFETTNELQEKMNAITKMYEVIENNRQGE